MTVPASTLLHEFTLYSMSERKKKPADAFEMAVQGVLTKQEELFRTFAQDHDLSTDDLTCRIQSISHDLLFFPSGFLTSAEYQVSIVAIAQILTAFDDFQGPTTDDS